MLDFEELNPVNIVQYGRRICRLNRETTKLSFAVAVRSEYGRGHNRNLRRRQSSPPLITFLRGKGITNCGVIQATFGSWDMAQPVPRQLTDFPKQVQ